MVKKIFGQNILSWARNLKENLVQLNVGPKIVGLKKFWVQKYVDPKKFGPQNFGPKN